MNALDLLTLACALGSGLVAGFFFAFSVCVMWALGKLPPPQGVGAMQVINVVVINPLFLGVFLGTAALSALMLALSLLHWESAGAATRAGGSLLYLVGSFVVTMAFNVPRNDALARVAPETPEAATLWREYLSRWTAWNHVRMLAALGAAAAFTLAFRIQA
ncbi:MAG TPA: anthrone oxygenase family protein [Vicinamibacterales bacterium]|jgi:uncharacterized membrane protein|nr:anthrone oxygenase family protein [Vicinamibacterales bacterium]